MPQYTPIKDREDDFMLQQVLKLLDGESSESELVELSQLLKASSEVRSRYRQVIQLVADLHCLYQMKVVRRTRSQQIHTVVTTTIDDSLAVEKDAESASHRAVDQTLATVPTVGSVSADENA